jgi:hypothetical protein
LAAIRYLVSFRTESFFKHKSRSLIGNTSAGTIQILYAPVGSGAGKRAFDDHESGLNSYWQGLGIPAASNQVPYVSADFPAYFY